mmetsp:Transcript_106567/g.339930  ORF Transcript_106567/g.339930 Transcript_106567/m.339930 type:complete len:318 (+) Transcript_106567:68-1021(+)
MARDPLPLLGSLWVGFTTKEKALACCGKFDSLHSLHMTTEARLITATCRKTCCRMQEETTTAIQISRLTDPSKMVHGPSALLRKGEPPNTAGPTWILEGKLLRERVIDQPSGEVTVQPAAVLYTTGQDACSIHQALRAATNARGEEIPPTHMPTTPPSACRCPASPTNRNRWRRRRNVSQSAAAPRRAPTASAGAPRQRKTHRRGGGATTRLPRPKPTVGIWARRPWPTSRQRGPKLPPACAKPGAPTIAKPRSDPRTPCLSGRESEHTTSAKASLQSKTGKADFLASTRGTCSSRPESPLRLVAAPPSFERPCRQS